MSDDVADVILCVRVDAMDHPTDGSMMVFCVDCRVPVWLSTSGARVKATPICAECLIDRPETGTKWAAVHPAVREHLIKEGINDEQIDRLEAVTHSIIDAARGRRHHGRR